MKEPVKAVSVFKNRGTGEMLRVETDAENPTALDWKKGVVRCLAEGISKLLFGWSVRFLCSYGGLLVVGTAH